MGIDTETLKNSFRNMDDAALLRRWHGELTDEARPIAKAEIEARGLNVTEQAFAELKRQDIEDIQANNRRQKAVVLRFLFRLAMGILATAGGAIALLVLGGR